MSRAPARVARLLALSLSLAGCERTAPRKAPGAAVSLQARTPDGAPVAGMRFWANGSELGQTGADGRLTAELTASAAIRGLCPPTHQSRDAERRVQLPPGGNAPKPALTLRFECVPLRRQAALVVRAHGAPAGLPIRVQGEVVGHTDDRGIAHVLLSTRAHENVRVTLDTGAFSDLRPQDPFQIYALSEGEEVLLFEQHFKRRRKPKPRTRWTPAPKPPPRPYRID